MIEINARNLAERLIPIEKSIPINSYTNGYKRAAVLVPLIWHEHDWHILYTKRTETIPHHKGQISFPGGMTEADDKSFAETALRETEEELGVSRNSILVVGSMDEFLAVSGVTIMPFVGIMEWPQKLNLSVAEVSRVILIPVDWLSDPTHHREGEYHGYKDVVFYNEYEGDLLWGITARLTKTFINQLQ
ncbi:MAG: CoA pyrophosphatase [Anaerolineaceae bacterium]|nr:CoA pyrophosphatase [Anaerolineaceae bacterium]